MLYICLELLKLNGWKWLWRLSWRIRLSLTRGALCAFTSTILIYNILLYLYTYTKYSKPHPTSMHTHTHTKSTPFTTSNKSSHQNRVIASFSASSKITRKQKNTDGGFSVHTRGRTANTAHFGRIYDFAHFCQIHTAHLNSDNWHFSMYHYQYHYHLLV